MSDFCLSEDEFSKAFLLIKSVVSETFVQSFQFKILNDILFLNSRLAKIGMIQNDLCTFCRASQETVKHLFFQCAYSKQFWNDFENYWISPTQEQRKFDYKSILIGVLDEKSDLLNYLIILGKLTYGTVGKIVVSPSFHHLKLRFIIKITRKSL